MNMKIDFNLPYLTGEELNYIQKAVADGKLSGNGLHTKKCHAFFEKRYHFKKTLLTTSCTDALEMSSLLLNIQEGDEVIIPSFTFVSTSNAFVLRGAKIIFADSSPTNPNIDPERIEELITPKTKAIVVVHYAGVACDMDAILAIALKHNLYVVEDAAQAVDSYYKERPLGGIGDLGTFSFHETKNIISGEGGMLAVNNEKFIERSEIIWEKGTNRSAFFRGEVDKYGWVDVGSSFLPSELIAAFLYAQLENLDAIQNRRKEIWQLYFNRLSTLQNMNLVKLPNIPSYATNNAHMFYLVCKTIEERTLLIKYLRGKGIHAVFHYLSLHKSPFYKKYHDGRVLQYCDQFADCLVRLPFFFQLSNEQLNYICDAILKFYSKNKRID